MQIKINLQIFLFILLFILTNQIEIYTITILFALIHELGHLTVGLLLKLKPKELNLMPFGFSILFEDYGYKKLLERKRIIIALAGPLTNLVIAIITYFLRINFEIKTIIIYSNILIAFFNMIPIYPLDGHKVLKGILKLYVNNIKAEYIVNRVSNITIIILTAFSSILILYLKNIWVILVLIYLWLNTIKENKKYSIKKALYKILQSNDKSTKYIDI